MNTIVRTIGGAIGAEVAASILVASVVASTGYPTRHGYTVTFVMCAVVLAVAVFASILRPGQKPHQGTRRGQPQNQRRPSSSPRRDRAKSAARDAGPHPTRAGTRPSALEGDATPRFPAKMCRDRAASKEIRRTAAPFSDGLPETTGVLERRPAAEAISRRKPRVATVIHARRSSHDHSAGTSAYVRHVT